MYLDLRTLILCGYVYCVTFGTLAFACGTLTHLEIGERARHFTNIHSEGVNYKQLIEKHPDAFQAGSPYPDAYYPDICFDGNFHQVSEDTHWTPFIKASIEYIRETYPKPWNEEGEKLVVFLLAVVQHQIADVSWHSLGIQQGFLSAMGKVNYHGSFSAAHSDGDFGGDVVNWFELDMDYIGTLDKWYVPTQDLLNIYKKMYGTEDHMTMEVVQNCTYLLFLGRLGESMGVIDLLYPDYAEASPFLVDRLNDYYLGGADDMAVWSQNTWKHTVTMLDRGTEVCELPYNPIYIQCNTFDEYARPKRYKSVRNRREADEILTNPGVDSERFRQIVELVDQDSVLIEETERGVYFSHALQENKSKRVKDDPDVDVVLPSTVYSTNIHYSRLGECIIAGDTNSDGFEDLVIGAPSFGVAGNYQQGRVYIIHGTVNGLPTRNLTVEEDADEILEGFLMNGRFGASLAIVDMNLDGINDLVVGAPSTGSDRLYYQGEVFVYYGGQLAGLSRPNFRISCKERYCNLGWSLSTGDLNGDGHDDLIVGAPFAPAGGEQRGLVGVLYASHGGHGDITENEFDWRWNGEQNYEWLGYSISVSQVLNSTNTLSVGAPTYRICARPDCGFDQADIQSVGMTYHFKSPLPDTPTQTKAGQQLMAQMGSSLAGGHLNGTNALAIASTSASSDILVQAGVVSLTLFDSLPLGQPLATYSGDREFSRFGTKIKIDNVIGSEKDDVVISAPYRSATLEDKREEGRVFVFNDSQKSGNFSAKQADMKLGLGEEKARFGSDLAVVNSRYKVQLAVSAPHSNARARLSGTIAVYGFNHSH